MARSPAALRANGDRWYRRVRRVGAAPTGGHGRTAPFGQLRIVDDDGDELPVGAVGKIVARGPMVMNGYHNRPELNAESLAGGWRRTNDLGRREADGSITFVGPKARMLKCGMENVYPAEVEQALRTHPGVAEVAVIGIPDDTFIQVVKAIVVATPGEEPTSDELVRHACGSLRPSRRRGPWSSSPIFRGQLAGSTTKRWTRRSAEATIQAGTPVIVRDTTGPPTAQQRAPDRSPWCDGAPR